MPELFLIMSGFIVFLICIWSFLGAFIYLAIAFESPANRKLRPFRAILVAMVCGPLAVVFAVIILTGTAMEEAGDLWKRIGRWMTKE